jgi:putative phosphoribosyl transferase
MMESPSSERGRQARLVPVAAGALVLAGELSIPQNARGIVILAQGSKNIEQLSSYSLFADALYEAGLATLLVHLLTEDEEQLDSQTQFFRFNVSILYQRIIGIAEWLAVNPETQNLSIGYFGGGPTGAAALVAAAERPDLVYAIVVGEGRIDLAQPYLARVAAPTLLMVRENDSAALQMNREALQQLPIALETNKKIESIASSAGLFEASDVLKQVVELTSQWFAQHLEPIV